MDTTIAYSVVGLIVSSAIFYACGQYLLKQQFNVIESLVMGSIVVILALLFYREFLIITSSFGSRIRKL